MIVAPGISLRRLGCTPADLALPCPGCGATVNPHVNSYDRFFYGCCGRAWSALLRDIADLRDLPGAVPAATPGHSGAAAEVIRGRATASDR